MKPKLLSLCTGYGGLEDAVSGVLDVLPVAYAENDPFASAVYAAHNPHLVNIGDVTDADWGVVGRVFCPDIIAAGFPCTDISNAGPRDGIHGERSGIWKNVAEAVRVIRPRLVFLENVSAILRRGIDVVAGDLAAIGYDARWVCVRASDAAGACHPRDRWFCVAQPAAADPYEFGRDRRTRDISETDRRREPSNVGDATPGVALLPTPAARDWKSGASNIMDRNSRPLNEFAVNLLPDTQWAASNGKDYGPAIRRWEGVTGRSAPRPTEPGSKGNRRLSPLFVEWMMGLPEGWVTGVPGVTRKEQLRILGNGVVPQQGAAAYRYLLNVQG